MDGAFAKSPLLIGCLLAVTVAGCANRSWMPFHTEPDRLDGVPSPSERVAKLQKLAENAKTTEPAQKQKIAEELAQEIKKEDDALIRAEIVRTLATYPSPAADAILRAAVNDPDVDVRVMACGVWGKRGDAEAAKLLGGVLTSDIDREVRLAAARALGQTHDPAAIASLGTALEDSDPAMQYRAVISLRSVSGRDFGNDVNLWREYVKNGSVKPAESGTLAERLRHLF
jgi:HEAT repeat protein